MTDDEIREALRLDFEQTADWRRSKAADDPEGGRNLEAAALLDKLAAWVGPVAPTALLDAYGSLRDDYMDSEQHSEMFRQIGFHSWPETAEDFVKACIAESGQWEHKVRGKQAEAEAVPSPTPAVISVDAPKRPTSNYPPPPPVHACRRLFNVRGASHDDRSTISEQISASAQWGVGLHKAHQDQRS